MPAYLRRASIGEAIGCYSSYYSNLQNWLKEDIKTRGTKPTLQLDRSVMPTFYNGGTYIS